MKKTKLIMPILGVSTIAAVAAPMVSCGDKNDEGGDGDVGIKEQEVLLNTPYTIEVNNIAAHARNKNSAAFLCIDKEGGVDHKAYITDCSYQIDDQTPVSVEPDSGQAIVFGGSINITKSLKYTFTVTSFEDLPSRENNIAFFKLMLQ